MTLESRVGHTLVAFNRARWPSSPHMQSPFELVFADGARFCIHTHHLGLEVYDEPLYVHEEIVVERDNTVPCGVISRVRLEDDGAGSLIAITLTLSGAQLEIRRVFDDHLPKSTFAMARVVNM